MAINRHCVVEFTAAGTKLQYYATSVMLAFHWSQVVNSFFHVILSVVLLVFDFLYFTFWSYSDLEIMYLCEKHYTRIFGYKVQMAMVPWKTW